MLETFTGTTNLPTSFLIKLDRVLRGLDTAGVFIETTAAAYTLTDADKIGSLRVDATAGAATVYLPSSPTGNFLRRIIKTDVSVNAVTIDGNGYLINGAATQTLAAQYNSYTLEPTGTGWLIVSAT